ncbi:fumarylacetoacetate hydrolase family protein [Undibacterium sp. RTI2.1]|uniref:fumarylacetoacetate hydrolase family protein n=1 Tax=unclassified Undibacterium TaxID=2630295 RepID=UPI002AB3B236|nr:MULTISPECIES: fumarylacetoacetate hydrolase family protein [unclassified Undibacterium]MDY7540622.1 fumarylacetoacetate hydrolase family protein [Undibacterium sp. 5I1]MEB0029715.1 fumarylacetoacetate hydrolase family protein [Undibacterium sp. RTI2.1]MEB0117493.1 fumarylacetoacetate hydrolase family protein [Undibacterium sp. RTI2.2]MEB0230798.1 fumarylacetoacetate hydrolase family protein [Undibacterium sp. 10I3]MEB0256587.1 fumarylacetoacetate hydrolase family protein [Undibacterium sp. 
MSYLFPPKVVSVPVANSELLFPVHRIYCVGRNYVEHAKEMGWTGREAPFFFMKPADAVLPVAYGQTGEMPYPGMTNNLHYEVELVVAIGKGGKNITVEAAAGHVWGYAVGLDMTRRDLQAESKDQGRPWDTAKGFDFSAPISPLHPIADTGWIEQGNIHLDVNGVQKQDSDIKKLIWNVAEVISTLSTFYELQEGDLIYSGTPEGVGPVKIGDLMEASIEGLGDLKVRMAKAD